MVKTEFGIKHFKIGMEVFELLTCTTIFLEKIPVVIWTFEGIFLNLDNTLGV